MAESEETREVEEIVIGFDFEAAGGNPSKNGFTQLGASAHEFVSGKKLGGFNKYANMEGFEWEPRCVEQFWKKNPERYEETLAGIAAAEHSCAEVVQQFVEWAREISKDRKCVFVSDNMIFDGGILSHFMGDEVMYLLGGTTKTVYFETSSVYYGMFSAVKRRRIDHASDDWSSSGIALDALSSIKNKAVEWPLFDVVHDHQPEHDAEHMVQKWIYVQNCLDVNHDE